LAGGTWWQATLCLSNATAWAHVLAHEPDSRIARLELANDALARRETGAAIDQLQQLVAHVGNNADAHLRLGEVLMDQGSVDEATAHFEKAAALRPDDPSVWRHRGAAAMRKDDLSAAAAYYQKALSLDPRDDIAQNNLATLFVRQGQIDRAIDAYTKLVKDNPRNAVAHINLARLLFDTGRPTESAEHLKQAVAIDPANFDAYLTAGDVLMTLKDFHQAQRMFQQAVHLKRENAPALNALGVSYAAQGLWNEAVYQFGRALDVDPNYEPAKKNLDSARRDRDAAATQPR
jgi:tetratricopeptide (TPR) repeat protein